MKRLKREFKWASNGYVLWHIPQGTDEFSELGPYWIMDIGPCIDARQQRIRRHLFRRYYRMQKRQGR